MKALITVATIIVFIMILQHEGRYIAFIVMGVMGAAVVAALIDSLHTRR